MNCVNCNRSLKDGVAFCPYCGTKQSAAEKKMYCGNCGSSVSVDAAFCANCGAACKPQQQAQAAGQSFGFKSQPAAMRPASYYTLQSSHSDEPRDVVISFCGDGTAFVFTVLFTFYLLLNVFTNLNLLWIIRSIPSILICAGCWITWQSCTQKRPNTTGFSLINVGLIILEACWTISFVVGSFLSCLTISQASRLKREMLNYHYYVGVDADYIKTLSFAGWLSLLICIVCIVLVIAYYNGMRVTVTSASRVIYGGGTEWLTSRLSIVLLIIDMIRRFISLFLTVRINEYMAKILEMLSYYARELADEFFDIDWEINFGHYLIRSNWMLVVMTLFSIIVSLAALFIILCVRSKKQTFADRWVAQDNDILKQYKE